MFRSKETNDFLQVIENEGSKLGRDPNTKAEVKKALDHAFEVYREAKGIKEEKAKSLLEAIIGVSIDGSFKDIIENRIKVKEREKLDRARSFDAAAIYIFRKFASELEFKIKSPSFNDKIFVDLNSTSTILTGLSGGSSPSCATDSSSTLEAREAKIDEAREKDLQSRRIANKQRELDVLEDKIRKTKEHQYELDREQIFTDEILGRTEARVEREQAEVRHKKKMLMEERHRAEGLKSLEEQLQSTKEQMRELLLQEEQYARNTARK